MSIEPIELAVGAETYDAVVDAENEDADAGVVILPGAGHGPSGGIFDVVAYELSRVDAQVLRYESWEDRDELEAKTLAELQAELDAAVERLRSRGCSTVQVLAKSFGGGIALSHVPDAVERLVLWAPAVELGVDPADANGSDERIGDSDSLVVALPDLDHVDVPVRILRGDEDEGVSPDDCERIVDAVDDGEVTEIPGEDHSFNRNRPQVVDRTLDYLVTGS